MKSVSSHLSNWKSEVDKLDFDKLIAAPFDLSKLSDVVKNDTIKKKNIYSAKIKNVDDKIAELSY